AHALDQSGIAVLQELYLYREQQARRRDLPVFKVMGDQTLLKLAERRPPSLREMRRIPGLTEGQIQRYGVGILRAIRRGLTAPPPPPPARNGQHPGQAVLRRFDALHAWRKERAARRGVPSDIVMSKETLWELARAAPRTRHELEALHLLGPWRLKTYGDEVLRVLAEADGSERHAY
ncbi:MAG TPA: hypothetical protein ENI95_07875, partial [Chloroflexi bacterium]|nr:hypothetical protein [Chloroflexota bacterium]